MWKTKNEEKKKCVVVIWLYVTKCDDNNAKVKHTQHSTMLTDNDDNTLAKRL